MTASRSRVARRGILLALLVFAIWLALRGLVASGVWQAPQEVGPTLRIGIGAEPESLDPRLARSEAAGIIVRDLYEGLISEAADGTLVAGAAANWSVDADGTRYTFTLRPTAHWSTGQQLVADDFVRGMRAGVDPATGAPNAPLLAPIRNAGAVMRGERPVSALDVSAPDPRTLVIGLNAPSPHFLSVLAHPISYPLHRAGVQTIDGLPLGNGAYALTERRRYAFMHAIRNPYYHDFANVEFGDLRYYPVEDVGSELKRWRAGELDITATLPSSEITALRELYPRSIRIAPVLNTYFYGFNLARPPFAGNPALRRALVLAIDRELLTAKITGAGEQGAWGIVPPGTAFYTPQTVAAVPADDAERLAEAKRLYRAAGYGDDNPARFELRYNHGENHRRVAVAVAAMWQEQLGVEVTLQAEEWKVLLQTRRAGEVTQVFRSGWVGDYNDALSFLELFHSEHPLNDYGYRSSQYDGLLSDAAAKVDPAARRLALEAAERRLLADLPVVPLYFHVSRHLVRPSVAGWDDNVLDHHLARHLRPTKAPAAE